MKKNEAEQEKYLPTIIHTIWAGGKKKIPDEGIANIASWAYRNPDFTVILWVDDKVVPPGTNLSDLQELYKKQFTEAYLQLASGEENASEVRERLVVKSIRESGICKPEHDIVDYAIDRLDPNYGLSSDLLRYRILHQYGGVYVDVTDVTPGNMEGVNFLKSIKFAQFGKINTAHKLFVDHLSQTPLSSEESPEVFSLSTRNFKSDRQEEKATIEHENERFLSTSRLGNDSFICTKGNPLMRMMVEETEKRLHCRTMDEKIMMAYGGFNIKDMTLDLSGPNVVKTIICDGATGELKQNKQSSYPNYYKKMPSGSGSYLLPLKHGEFQAVKPPDNVRNTRYWNNVPLDVSRIKSIDDAIESIHRVALYEVIEMGVLRLDDHMRLITQVAGMIQVPPEKLPEVYNKLLLSLKKLPLEKVSVAQCISTNPVIKKFYQESGLIKHIVIDTESSDKVAALLKIWEQCTSHGRFMGTIDYHPDVLKSVKVEDIIMKLKDLEIVDIHSRIERGTNFIKLIKENMDAYPQYKELLTQNPQFQKLYLTEVISKYFKILDAYSEAFIRRGVEPSAICSLGQQLMSIATPEVLPKKLQLLVKHYGAKSVNHALRIVASKGSVEHIEYLVKYSDINEQGGKSGKTALHQAAANGHQKVMECLIDYGADKTIQDSDNKTAEQLYTASPLTIDK